MVAPRLMGRCGNQMFQLAMAKAYSLKHGLDFYMPDQTTAPHVWECYFAHLSKGEQPQLINPSFIKERIHSYRHLPSPIDGRDIIVEGYWQTEKYFKEYRKEIIEMFNIEYKPLLNYCSVHIRRGDYLLYPDKHPVITPEYLNTAISLMREKGIEHFMFFSDDMEWAIDFASKVEGIIPIFTTGSTPLMDLQFMNWCGHQIIANSSFSWWGAWLNQNPDKIVIAPKVWFGEGNAHLDTQDLIPESWIKL